MKKFYTIIILMVITISLNECSKKDCIPDGTGCDALKCEEKCCSEKSHSDNRFEPYDGPAFEICGAE